jgi:hypothetical protein
MAVALFSTTGIFGLATSHPVGAAGSTATIAVPGTNTPLSSGGSETRFTVGLPPTTACPGDTARDGDHVYSYLVHQGVNPASVTFVNAPSAGYGIVDATGEYYGPVNTSMGTGEIIGIPNDFQWAPLTTGDGGSVPLQQLLYQGESGIWETGIACVDTHGALADYWNVQVTFTSSPTDPTGFTWSADEPGALAVNAPTPTTLPATTTPTATIQGSTGNTQVSPAPAPTAASVSGHPAAGSEGSGSGDPIAGAPEAASAARSSAGVTGTTATGWIAVAGLTIVVVGVGIIWLARRQRVKKPTDTGSAR